MILDDFGWMCELLGAKLREKNLKIFKVFLNFTRSNSTFLFPSWLVVILNHISKELGLRKYRDRKISAIPTLGFPQISVMANSRKT